MSIRFMHKLHMRPEPNAETHASRLTQTMKFFLAISVPTLALISSLGWSTPKTTEHQMSDGKGASLTTDRDHLQTFPNRGNPNAIQEQQANVCISLKPVEIYLFP